MTLPAKPEPREVLIDLIDEPELPARMSMNEDKLDELVSSIRKIGVLQRLLVMQNGDRYEIVAGHRRFLASKRAGLVAVPCDVFPTKESALEAVKHAENRFREDMTPAEEAVYFNELLERDCGGDIDRLCEVVNERRQYVEDRILLLQGARVVFDALAENKIKLGVAVELNKVTDERVQRGILHDAIQNGSTVAVVRGMVTEWKRSKDRGTSDLPAPESSEPMGALPQSNWFTCYCCGGTDDPGQMIAINVHPWCKRAILDVLMKPNTNPA